MDLHVPEYSVSGAAGASVPWVLLSAAEAAEACAARVRGPAPGQGLSPAGSPPRASACVTSPPTDAAVGSCGEARELRTGDLYVAGVAVLASGWEQGSPDCAGAEGVCLHPLPSLRRAGLENQGRQAGGLQKTFFFFFLTTTGLHCGCRIFSCGMQLLGCSIWSLVP